MGALDFVIYRFTDIVQQRASFGDGYIGANFGRDHAGNVGHLNGVLQHILTIRGAEMQSPQDTDDTRIKVEDSAFVSGLLAFFFNNFAYFLLGLLYHFLNFGWLNAAVLNQVFQSYSRYLPTHWIVGREGNETGSVVYYHFYSRCSFKSFDVPTLLADNFALDFVRRDGDGGRKYFRGYRVGQPMDGGGEY